MLRNAAPLLKQAATRSARVAVSEQAARRQQSGVRPVSVFASPRRVTILRAVAEMVALPDKR